MPFFWDKKIEIKSVPPLVASTLRHMVIATAFKRPPNTAARSSSFVKAKCGRRSTKIPFATTIIIENKVNLLPMNLKPM